MIEVVAPAAQRSRTPAESPYYLDNTQASELLIELGMALPILSQADLSAIILLNEALQQLRRKLSA